MPDMAGDQKKFNKAQLLRQEHIANGRVSCASGTGKVAIMAANLTIAGSPDRTPMVIGATDKWFFRDEAKILSRRYASRGIDSRLFFDVTSAAFQEVMADTSFSGVEVIGHGALSYIYARNLDKGTSVIDWSDIAGYTTHLKLGSFVQRCCGNSINRLNVPLGTFAMRYPENSVLAPKDYFYPLTPGDGDDRLEPVLSGVELGYRAILDAYPKQMVYNVVHLP